MSLRGFTLIELTIAVVLLSIGLLALSGALAAALHATVSARAGHAALRAAEAVADSLAYADTVAAGAVAQHDIDVRWQPMPCPLGECVQVSATHAGDTITLLARSHARLSS